MTRSMDRAEAARRTTWAIIGSPASMASDLPGNRVEAHRAGMTAIVPGFTLSIL
jgi:hypothetical protein